MLEGFLRVVSPLIVPLRGRKRLGVKLQRMAKEKKKGTFKEKTKVVKRSWLETHLASRASASGAVSTAYPARIPEHEIKKRGQKLEQLKDAPEDNVFIARYYKPRIYTLEESIQMHREVMHPTVYNNPSAPVKLRLDLNMNLEKAGKFVNPQAKVIVVPNVVEFDRRRSIFALVQDKELQAKAVEAGADAAGGKECVKKITKGEIRADSYNFFICHADMVTEITPLRGILKSKFPNKPDGNLGTDIVKMTKHFREGMEVEVQRDFHKPQFGVCNVNIARLDWEISQIEDNLRAFLTALCTLRPMTPALGHFIHRAVLMVPNSLEYFAIPFWDYAPAIPGMDELKTTPAPKVAAPVEEEAPKSYADRVRKSVPLIDLHHTLVRQLQKGNYSIR